MKSTGIIRHLDELGRIVLPMEIRNNLDISPRDKLEIFVEGEKIILKKQAPSCALCGSTRDNIIFNDKRVCKTCITKLNEQNQ